ncbi:MAG: winged helix-turn-helix domain-containing protein [Halobacteria archaeon]
MEKGFHPKAYLILKRNVKAGLYARSKIVQALESGNKTIKEICENTGLNYSRIAYHIRTLLNEKIVRKISKTKPYSWALTEFGQQKLVFQ